MRGVNYSFLFSVFQNGDSNYFLSLAARYSQELGSSYSEVLQQLEDLRLAEWSDHAPPVPSLQQLQNRQRPPQHQQQNYVNYPNEPATRVAVSLPHLSSNGEPIYVPGQYQVIMIKLILRLY